MIDDKRIAELRGLVTFQKSSQLANVAVRTSASPVYQLAYAVPALLDEIERLRAENHAAVAAEREACAKIADDFGAQASPEQSIYRLIAHRIRARGKQ